MARAALYGLQHHRHRTDPRASRRLSVCGELGYEINCHASEHITLRNLLLEAGVDFEMREFGFLCHELTSS